MKNLKGKIVALTGAGSGIGRALAIALAKEGCHLALTDIHEQNLAETCRLLNSDIEIRQHIFDAGDREAVYKFAEHVVGDFGKVDIIMNNAGVALGKMTAEEVSYEDFEWLMQINFWGMVYGTKAFLPILKEQKEAAVVNISSLFGLSGIAWQSAYCSSKFAIRGFTESLYMEALHAFPHVQIHSVHPGGIQTNIVKNSRWKNTKFSEEERAEMNRRFEKQFITTPEKAAKEIITGVKKNKMRIIVGKDARFADKMIRFFPNIVIKQILKRLPK